MLRRPLTSIELKLDDVSEYNDMQEKSKDQMDVKSYNTPPNWIPGTKTKQEIHKRIGYAPQRIPSTEY